METQKCDNKSCGWEGHTDQCDEAFDNGDLIYLCPVCGVTVTEVNE